jgi:hypothetical protein
MTKLEDLTKEELFELVLDLMRDGAEVQGCSIKEFAEDYHDIDWGDDDE